MSTDRDYVRPDRPSRSDRDEDYEDDDYGIRRRRYDRVGYGRSQDEEHLRILSILYYVLGGLGLLGGLFPLIYVVFGVVIAAGALGTGAGAPPAAVGFFMIAIGGAISMVILALAGCTFYTGYCLAQHKNYMFCFVIACLSCMHMPLGTLLGVFTIVVLVRPGVKEMFGVGEPAPRLAADE